MNSWDWSELAFGSKKPVNSLKATFIAAPRELSATRFTQLVKEYLPKGNILLGFAKEEYVLGFEEQPQFRMLKAETVQSIIDKVNNSPSKYKIATLAYAQRDLLHVIKGLSIREVGAGEWLLEILAPHTSAILRVSTAWHTVQTCLALCRRSRSQKICHAN
nr:Unknown Function [uncultured bacterium]